MCFYNDDYDWVANVQEITETDSGDKQRCSECWGVIQPWEWRRHYYFQENDESDWDEEIEEREFETGETSEFWECFNCRLVRNAIIAVEQHEGCDHREAEPATGNLYEAVQCGEGFLYYADKHFDIAPGEYVPWPIDADKWREELCDIFGAAYRDRLDSGFDVGGEG